MSRNVVFVDFFDTIMFRHIHPLEVTQRWAENICRKYRLHMTAEELITCRTACFQRAYALKRMTAYEAAMILMWDAIGNSDPHFKDISQRDFLEFARKTEIALEIAVQYPNRKLLRQLQKKKRKGAQIYIVSDFYFGKTELLQFCEAQDIDISLFNEIFVSADFGATKHSGKLYRRILDILDCSGEQVQMIGDNAYSDGKMARQHDILPVLHRRVLYKCCLHLKRMMGYDFAYHAGKIIVNKCYRGELPFAEYIAIFYSFTERLKSNIFKDEKVVFLSREGHFLKRLFEQYDYYVTARDEQTDVAYFLCSRRAITSTQMEKLSSLREKYSLLLKDYLYSAGIPFEEMPDVLRSCGIDAASLNLPLQEVSQAQIHSVVEERVQQNREALQKYAEETIGAQKKDKTINVVDIGWYGSMQMGLEKILGIGTKGFYLGTVGEEATHLRTGLVFSSAEHKKRQTYFEILKTNRQLYEQLSAAPHGAAQTYRLTEQGVTVPLAWEEPEKNLYDAVIRNWQERALTYFAALAVWCPVDREMFSNKHNSNIVLRSGLFADAKRLDFLKALDEGFVWNFAIDTIGTEYDRKRVKIDCSVITSPEKYVRYAVKVQRCLPRNWAVQLLYKLFAGVFLGFVKFVLLIKGTT